MRAIFLFNVSLTCCFNFFIHTEDFNRHIRPKDLSSEQLSELHKEALGLYHTYIAPGADDKIPLPPEIVASIKESKHDFSKNV